MAGHWYSRTGEALPEGFGYPSVTTILAIRHNAGLQAWRDREGAEEADRRSKEATDKGTYVHGWIEKGLRDGQFVYGDKSPHLPLLLGFMAWYDKVKPTKLQPEIFLYHELHEFAGTADLICEIDGEPWVLDWKSSKTIHPEYALQLAAYAEAYRSMTGIECRRGVLQLTDQIKRGYRFKEFTDDDDFGAFMSHKEVFDWNRKTEKRYFAVTT